MLRLSGVHASYGASRVLHGVDLKIAEGEIACLLGRNGMGKTTILRSIMGAVDIVAGSVTMASSVISKLQPHQIPRTGIGYVPQGRHIFPEFTVLENLCSGVVKGKPDGERLEWIFDLFPRLKERLTQSGGSLSGGEQQMLAIGRAFLPGPRLMLLDEPTEGLSPLLATAVREAIPRINERGVAILLVEQNYNSALRLSNTIHVVEKGGIKLSGNVKEFEGKVDELENLLGVARHH